MSKCSHAFPMEHNGVTHPCKHCGITWMEFCLAPKEKEA